MPEHITRETVSIKKAGRVRRWAATVLVSLEYLLVSFADAILDDWSIMRREVDLFLGSALILLGLFNWSSGKYCDGNTADYLSCTRPVTYYYYNTFEIILLLLGVSLVLLWFVKNKDAK